MRPAACCRARRARRAVSAMLYPGPGGVTAAGHEWAKQQYRKAGLGFTELSNGFAACDDPAVLERIAR